MNEFPVKELIIASSMTAISTWIMWRLLMAVEASVDKAKHVICLLRSITGYVCWCSFAIYLILIVYLTILAI